LTFQYSGIRGKRGPTISLATYTAGIKWASLR